MLSRENTKTCTRQGLTLGTCCLVTALWNLKTLFSLLQCSKLICCQSLVRFAGTNLHNGKKIWRKSPRGSAISLQWDKEVQDSLFKHHQLLFSSLVNSYEMWFICNQRKKNVRSSPQFLHRSGLFLPSKTTCHIALHLLLTVRVLPRKKTLTGVRERYFFKVTPPSVPASCSCWEFAELAEGHSKYLLLELEVVTPG